MRTEAALRPGRAERWGGIAMGAFVLIVVTAVVSWFLFGTVYGVGIGSPANPTPAPSPTNSTGVTSVLFYQTVSFNPWQGHDQYYPANFTVPKGIPVTFVISSYDNGVNYLPVGAGSVIGTQGGTELVQGGAPGTPQGQVDTFPANDTTHTFTIDQGDVHLNVIIPPTQNVSFPVRVTFTVVFPTAGNYIWFCQAPCDPYSMQTPGFMNGVLTVS